MEQDLSSVIKNLKDLKAEYDRLSAQPLSHDAMEAYHCWYEQSFVLFDRFFKNDCKEFVNFSSVDNTVTNGYVLKENYNKIRKDFCVLVDRLEYGEAYKGRQISLPAVTSTVSGKRVFISHSSEDQDLVNRFVDSILLLGMNIDASLIAYTSREDMGVAPGENIPKYIRDNIACADIVLLMISDNYKTSAVCLNEMGAAWALNRTIVQILLPNTSFDKLGWLCSLDKSVKINDSNAIDGLCEVFENKLDVRVKLSSWNRYKEDFVKSCQAQTPAEMTLVAVLSDHLQPQDDELGLLDYRERFDYANKMVNDICGCITKGLNDSNAVISRNAKQLQTLNAHNPSASQIKAIMRHSAKSMNDLAEIVEQNAPLLKEHFYDMVDYAVKVRSCVTHKEDVESGFDIVKDLLVSISGAKESMIDLRNEVEQQPNMEAMQNKAKKRLYNAQTVLIDVLDSCQSKAKDLVGVV